MAKKTPILSLKEVTKKFGQETILDSVSFDLTPKETVFLVGPSGAGKTTLFRLLSCEFLPTSGEIHFLEEKISDRLSNRRIVWLRRQIGRVFQDLKLIADRTIKENIEISFDIFATPHQTLEEVLALVGLENKANLFPAQLSEGEKQRVGIARALIYQPKILLVDEPTSNLDPANSWQIIKLLKKVNQEGTTLMIATHDEDVVNSLQARVIEIDQGKVVRDEAESKYQKTPSQEDKKDQ
ncbi:MAG: cell division ATP-binding protein FtsE [Patescibacteria group bacterium]|jgi:cell division transport system ATP-binding protein